MASSNNEFKFVLIPADDGVPIAELKASKEGGLTDDALIHHAKSYFHDLTGAKTRASVLENANPTERAELASQIRQQMLGGVEGSSGNTSSSSAVVDRLSSMDDDAVIETILKSQVQPSCDITALTIPTAGNKFKACSMYAAESAQKHGLSFNSRATALLTACGHAASDGVYGDVFCGRANDNEEVDVWERTDFLSADTDAGADWCRVARGAGGGGGSGGRTAASSLSNLVARSQMATRNDNSVQVMDGSGGNQGANIGTDAYGMNAVYPVVESWGSWTQTAEEVELKFAVTAGTKSKYCKVQFGRNSVKVVVAGQTLLQGTTFDPISLDESTFTLQDEGPTNRELCVTLGKVEFGRTWVYVVRP